VDTAGRNEGRTTRGEQFLHADVLVAGGGVGGCAAALAAAEAGLRVVLAEETAWIGGQLTSQITPPDEHGWIERFGCTASYRRYRDAVRAYYRTRTPLTAAARATPYLNPGNGWVSPLCHEPRVALAVLHAMLAPHVAAGRLKVLTGHRPRAVQAGAPDTIAAVAFDNEASGAPLWVSARWILDATELGDVIALSGAESVTGAESQAATGEPSARVVAAPEGAQAFSVCCAVDHCEGETHTIDRPASYERWRTYVPPVTPPWTGPLFSWTAPHPRTMAPITYRFHPNNEAARAFEGLWSYRRIVDRTLYEPGHVESDVCVINWVMLDHIGGDLVTADTARRADLIEAAREQTRALVYWLQTEAERPDGGQGWPGLRLRGDVTGTDDGLAMAPYIRESRRIQALVTIVERHVAAACRSGEALGESYPDSVGIGYYRIDLHPSVSGDNYVDVEARPFQIPLRALVPVRMRNLIAAAKNIGTTHVTNGCYRLHPVEWNIGEAAGAIAAWCDARATEPAHVATSPHGVADFQRHLVSRGVELAWPGGLHLEDGEPHRHAMR
jgi:hypothetical protein